MSLTSDRSVSRSRGFSLIELIVVIAVMSIMASVAVWYMFGIVRSSTVATENQNIQTWNTAYQNVIAANPEFVTNHPTWSDASSQMAAGVVITVGNSNMTITASIPIFSHGGDPTFVAGKGITAPPSGP